VSIRRDAYPGSLSFTFLSVLRTSADSPVSRCRLPFPRTHTPKELHTNDMCFTFSFPLIVMD